MKFDTRAFLVVALVVMAPFIIGAAWLLPDKTLFTALASALVSGGLGTVTGYYFGSSHSRVP